MYLSKVHAIFFVVLPYELFQNETPNALRRITK